VTVLLALALFALAPSPAQADARAGEKKVQLCLICHKPDNPHAYVPTLEGQTREYLYNQIKAFRERRRPDTVMQTNVATLSDRDIRDIADYFSSRPPVRGSFPLDAATAARGRSRVEALACDGCHGTRFSGKKEAPRLAGMEPRYLASQLRAFASGKRPHPAAERMRDLSGDAANDVAHYFAHFE
jgi:cytochrome c553